MNKKDRLLIKLVLFFIIRDEISTTNGFEHIMKEEIYSKNKKCCK